MLFALVLLCLPILLYFPKGPSPPDPPVNICCLPWFCYFCQFCCICLRGPAPQTPLCTYAYTCKSTFTCTYSTTYTHRCIHAHMLLFIHTYTMLQHRPNIALTWGLLPHLFVFIYFWQQNHQKRICFYTFLAKIIKNLYVFMHV